MSIKDYQKLIITMVKTINDKTVLIQIFTVIKNLIE